MKAPFSCPKSSESIVPSGIAPQFTAIYLPCFRLDRVCMMRGILSFPTPLSPVTRTEMSVGATCIAFSMARFSLGSLPMILNRCFIAWIFYIFL